MSLPSLTFDRAAGTGGVRSGSTGVQFRWKQTAIRGTGTAGTVWTGINRDNGKLLAIREVSISPSMAPKEVATVMKELASEFREASSLQNRFIVQHIGYEYQEEQRKLFVFSEYVSGSIGTILEQIGAFEERVIRRYTKQLLYGLDYLHNQDIIQNNFKVSNLLLDNNGNIKLSDYIGYQWLELLVNPDLHPTLRASISPTANPSSATAAAWRREKEDDIIRVGCIVLEMMTGQPWNQDRIPTSLEFPSELSADGRNFVTACLSCRKGEGAASSRMNVADLLNHPFFSIAISRADSTHVPFTPPSSAGGLYASDPTQDMDETISSVRFSHPLLASCQLIHSLLCHSRGTPSNDLRLNATSWILMKLRR